MVLSLFASNFGECRRALFSRLITLCQFPPVDTNVGSQNITSLRISLSQNAIFHSDVWKHGEAAPVSIVYPEANFRSITSQGGRNAHFFEFHPFTKHLYRTGTGNDLHKHDWYLFAAIPNSSSVAYIDRTESALIVYDMKKSMEVARLVDPSVRGARNLICSKNALVVSSYADFNRGYLMASIVCVWSASKLEKVSIKLVFYVLPG